MTLEARDQSPDITVHQLMPVNDLELLEEIAGEFGGITVEVLQTEGQEYHTRRLKHGTGGIRLELRLSKVPKGQSWISVRTDPHNFGFIKRELETRSKKLAS